MPLILLLLSLLLPGISGAQAVFVYEGGEDSAPTTSSRLRVACLGDSNTAGGQGGTSWPKLLETKLGADKALVKNFGISGDTAANMVNRWRADIRDESYDVLVMLAGTNDLTSGATGATVAGYVGTITTEALARGMRVVILNLMPRRTETACGGGIWSSTLQTHLLTANSLFLGYCDPGEATCIDTYSLVGDGTGREDFLKTTYRADCIHLNAVGYDAVATAVRAVLP